jgi:RimJ/RimL family protein N-acetyltransferase
MNLRPMTMDDSDFMLSLKNDPDTRFFALLTSQEIKREDHIKFLEKNIQYFTVMVNGNDTRVGAFRIQDNEVSVWVDKNHRKQRYAYFALLEVVKSGMTAKVVIGNLPSMRLFSKLGFLPIEFNPLPLDHYILQKP